MIGFQINPNDNFNTALAAVKKAVSLGGQLIRYQLVDPTTYLDIKDPSYYGKRPLEQQKREAVNRHIILAQICETIEREKIPVKIIVDCHSPVGGVYNSIFKVHKHKAVFKKKWTKAWQELWLDCMSRVERFNCILGYDLINEPACPLKRWRKFTAQQVKYLREYTDKTFYLNIPLGPIESFDSIVPVKDSNTTYSYHCYWPLGVSYYGVEPKYNLAKYEAQKARDLNYQSIKRFYQPIINFSKKYNQKIFIGECGCSNKGASQTKSQFLCYHTQICIQQNWDITMHALSDHPIWEIEKNHLEWMGK